MKNLIRLTVFVSTIVLLNFILTRIVHAQDLSLSYPDYNVDIKVNSDSTFVVTETVNYTLDGFAHGLVRDLTLYDSQKTQDCIDNPDLTCGGFDRVNLISAKDSTGKDIPNDQFSLGEVDDQNSGSRYEEFKWTIWPNGQNVTNYDVGWILQYKVYGGIQSIGDNPYFYWNMLPDFRDGTVQNSKLTIELPNNVTPLKDSLSVFADYDYNSLQTSNGFEFDLNDLPDDGGNFTAAYKFQPSEIQLPGEIDYTANPQFGDTVLLDGFQVSSNGSDKLKGVEAGNHTLEIQHTGYQTSKTQILVQSGKTQTVSPTLQPESWMNILLLANNLFILLGCGLIPAAAVFVYLFYRAKGHDKKMPPTIIPLYTPPVDTPPYLLGTVKDESVEHKDIVGTIIDLAYRGFLTIKEVTKDTNYEMTRTNKSDSSLNDSEKQILDAIFNGEDSRETKDMQFYFPQKYQQLTSRIYSEIVEKGFFTESPKTTIAKYFGLGMLLLILGGAASIFISIGLTTFLGYLSFFTIGAALATVGLGFIIVAKFMPAKTEKGSKLYADILGFRMYLNTAERYRLQKLGPEEFEKYLSYAVVFGIEKEWAKKFEGIYNQVPTWYVGSGNVYDAIFISSFIHSFTYSTVSAMTYVPASRNSSFSGGGWSGGGGSFGGFSGGGGGGGHSGGF